MLQSIVVRIERWDFFFVDRLQTAGTFRRVQPLDRRSGISRFKQKFPYHKIPLYFRNMDILKITNIISFLNTDQQKFRIQSIFLEEI